MAVKFFEFDRTDFHRITNFAAPGWRGMAFDLARQFHSETDVFPIWKDVPALYHDHAREVLPARLGNYALALFSNQRTRANIGNRAIQAVKKTAIPHGISGIPTARARGASR